MTALELKKEKLENLKNTMVIALELGTFTQEEADKLIAEKTREIENIERIIKRQKECPNFFYHGI
jgi:hypothetical protein